MRPRGDALAGRTVAVGCEISAAAAARLTALGARLVRCGHLRAETYQALVKQQAALGADSAGRIWHTAGGHLAADALVTLAILLGRLSGDDRPLSQVLDAELRDH